MFCYYLFLFCFKTTSLELNSITNNRLLLKYTDISLCYNLFLVLPLDILLESLRSPVLSWPRAIKDSVSLNVLAVLLLTSGLKVYTLKINGFSTFKSKYFMHI